MSELVVRDSGAGLAEALVACEGRLGGAGADRIVLADDSDAALAAALVGAKAQVTLVATPEATGGESVNARLIAQLADTYTEAG